MVPNQVKRICGKCQKRDQTKYAFVLRFRAVFVCLRFPSFFLFSLFIDNSVFMQDVVCQWVPCIVHNTTTSLTNKIFTEMCLLVGPVHCSRDPQTSFFNKTFIKNGIHGTKISGIQMDPKISFKYDQTIHILFRTYFFTFFTFQL